MLFVKAMTPILNNLSSIADMKACTLKKDSLYHAGSNIGKNLDDNQGRVLDHPNVDLC